MEISDDCFFLLWLYFSSICCKQNREKSFSKTGAAISDSRKPMIEKCNIKVQIIINTWHKSHLLIKLNSKE